MTSLGLLITLAIYTVVMIVGILTYENKVTMLRSAIEDYKRALKYAKGNTNSGHYTHLQIENQNLRDTISVLSQANDHLQAYNKSLQKTNQDLMSGWFGAGKQEIQYESSTYKGNTWESNLYANDAELEENPPFIRKYGDKS